MKVGDLIFWHGRNTIALVVSIDACPNEHAEAWWVCLLEEGGALIYDDLPDGHTVIDENWNWPSWHVNNKQPKVKISTCK